MGGSRSDRPAKLEPYAYVANRPLNFVDPLGLGNCVIFGVVYQSSDWVCGGLGSGGLSGGWLGYPPGGPASGNVVPTYVPIYSEYWDDGPGKWVLAVESYDIVYVDIGGFNATNFNATNNGVTGTITAGPPDAKKDFCSHQANLAALESILPGSANAIQGDYRAIAGTATSEALQEYAVDAAANSTSFLLTIRSWLGIPMSVTSKALSIGGYAGMAYTAYSALKASQTEYAACMQ